MPDPGKILIIQTAFLGDVILTTSLVEALSLKFPDSGIDFMVRKGNQIILKNNPRVDEVLILDKSKKFSESLRLIKKLRRKKYDLIINAQRHFTTGLITSLSGAKMKIGYSDNPFSFFFSKKIKYDSTTDSGLHEVEKLNLLIKDQTGAKFTMPKVYISSEEEEKVKPFLINRFITIHPGSVWLTKQFPKEKWIEFIDKIDSDITVCLLGGPREYHLCQQILEGSSRNNINNLAGELNLIESAALMIKARMNYTNDSAPLHLCSAVDAPCAAVLCSTIPEFGFGPLSSVSHVIQIKEKLSCRPCGRHGKRRCPKGHFHCALKISTEDLLQPLQ